MEGWIKVYRSLMESKYGRNAELLGFWLILMLRANHADGYTSDGVHVNKGSFKTGRKQLSLETGLNESKVERFLKKLEIEQQIEQQTHAKYRIISIVNWSKYQGTEQEIEQVVNNKRTTSEQQVNTNKNVNNKKNKKNNTMSGKTQRPIAKEILKYFNTVTHKSFRETETNLKFIIAILKVASSAEIKSVIDDRVKLWSSDAKMQEYLRPSTIFRKTNFENYLAESKQQGESNATADMSPKERLAKLKAIREANSAGDKCT